MEKFAILVKVIDDNYFIIAKGNESSLINMRSILYENNENYKVIEINETEYNDIKNDIVKLNNTLAEMNKV